MGWNGFGGVKMSHLSRGMNTSISPTRAMEGNRITQDCLNHSLNVSLHSPLLRLPLPTMEVCADILNHQGNPLGLSPSHCIGLEFLC